MMTEVNVGGILIAPLVVYGMAAMPMFLVLRLLLGRLRLLRAVWHPALFELALYVSIVCLLVRFV
jgi:hypothetical protein